jgi:hypothetical protein
VIIGKDVLELGPRTENAQKNQDAKTRLRTALSVRL